MVSLLFICLAVQRHMNPWIYPRAEFCSIGEVEELALTVKAAQASAAEGKKLSAARPATGRMSLLVVAGVVGK